MRAKTMNILLGYKNTYFRDTIGIKLRLEATILQTDTAYMYRRSLGFIVLKANLMKVTAHCFTSDYYWQSRLWTPDVKVRMVKVGKWRKKTQKRKCPKTPQLSTLHNSRNHSIHKEPTWHKVTSSLNRWQTNRIGPRTQIYDSGPDFIRPEKHLVKQRCSVRKCYSFPSLEKDRSTNKFYGAAYIGG